MDSPALGGIPEIGYVSWVHDDCEGSIAGRNNVGECVNNETNVLENSRNVTSFNISDQFIDGSNNVTGAVIAGHDSVDCGLVHDINNGTITASVLSLIDHWGDFANIDHQSKDVTFQEIVEGLWKDLSPVIDEGQAGVGIVGVTVD